MQTAQIKARPKYWNAYFAFAVVLMFFVIVNESSKNAIPVSSFHRTADTTKPVIEKKYQVVLTKSQWSGVMNILAGANYYIGRTLTVDSADVYKSNLLLVQNEFMTQLQVQLKADTVKKKGN